MTSIVKNEVVRRMNKDTTTCTQQVVIQGSFTSDQLISIASEFPPNAVVNCSWDYNLSSHTLFFSWEEPHNQDDLDKAKRILSDKIDRKLSQITKIMSELEVLAGDNPAT